MYLWEYSFVTIKYYKEVYFKLFEVWSKGLSWRWFHIWIFFWVDSRCIHIFFSLKFFSKFFFQVSTLFVICNFKKRNPVELRIVKDLFWNEDDSVFFPFLDGLEQRLRPMINQSESEISSTLTTLTLFYQFINLSFLYKRKILNQK